MIFGRNAYGRPPGFGRGPGYWIAARERATPADDQVLGNIHTACEADVRHIYGKVEITYSDPYRDESLTITPSDTAYGTDPIDTCDNLEGCLKDWFEIGVSKLNGLSYLVPSQDGSIGWWSKTKAASNGTFSTPPTLEVSMAQAVDLNNLKVIGDNVKDEYPVSFTIKLYDASNNLLHTENVTDNDQYDWRKDLTPTIEGVMKMVLTINSINTGSTCAKITEFYTAYNETYYDDDLFGITLLEEMDYESGTLPIGNISANEITVKLDNSTRRFTPGNPHSPVASLMLKNRRIRAWLGVEVVGEVAYYPIGVFWSMDWHVPDDEVYAEVVGYDRLEFLRTSIFNPHEVFVSQTLYDLIEEVLTDAGLLEAEYTIDESLDSITIPYAWFDEVTHRYALTKLCEAGLARAYCDRNGRVVVEPFTAPANVSFTFTSDNFFTKDHPLKWSEMVNQIEVTANPLTASAEETIYADADTVAVPAGSDVTKFYIFTHSPCIDVQEPDITQSGADISVYAYTAYSWGISVTFRNTGGTSQNVTSVTIDGKKLESTGKIRVTETDDDSIAANGLVGISIDNDFIQSRARAEDIAETLLASYKDPRRDITLKCRGDIALKLGDLVIAPDYLDEVTDEYIVVRQEFEWTGRLEATVTARRSVE